MSTDIEYMRLAPNDTLSALRDRLSGLRGMRVLLVWPPEGNILARKLDLVLIQREADRRAIQLAIVSPSPRLQFFAAELNISCFPTIEASKRERWRRGRQKRFLPRYHKPNADTLAADLAYMRARRTRHSPWRTFFERIIALALLVAAIGAALYTVLPGAVITASLQMDRIDAVFDIIADRKAASVDIARSLIPAQTIKATVETSATIPTSGSARLDSASAGAVVTFTNLGETSVDIPRGTILGTSAGEPILFVTAADVVVPAGAGQHVDAAVQAMEGYRGSIGNVGPGMINTVLGALADSVTAINLTSAAGGSNRSVKSVAVADQDKLLEILRIQLQSLAYEQMRAALSDSQVIVIESIRIEEERKEWTQFSADPGTMTSELSLTMRAVVSALAIDDRFGRQLLLARLKAAAPADKMLLLDSVSYTRGPFSQTRADGQVSFTVAGSGVVIAQIDRNQLRERLAGLSLAEAHSLLAADPAVSKVDPPEFQLYPSSLSSMPLLPIRINVQVRDAQ